VQVAKLENLPDLFCSGESGEIDKKNYAIFLLPSFSERKIIPLVAWFWVNHIDPNEDTKNAP
jgi:hypothetical protein